MLLTSGWELSAVHARDVVAWLAGCVAAVGAVVAPAAAQVDPNSGIDFVTIGAPGNRAWAGDGTGGDRAIGRGSVAYEYRIGRFEVTTAQWVEFFNAAFDRPAGDRLPHLIPPTFWGAAPTAATVPGGQRWRVPAGNEMRAVGNIDWRMAAMYCNWLHNDKSTTREAFLSGAYEVSTFGYTGPRGDTFTDQLARSPGARYFIPTWDEWLKAAYYDPNKQRRDGSGELGEYWLYPNATDTPLGWGPPGSRVRFDSGTGQWVPDLNGVLAQANASWDESDFPGFSPFSVPLGAYAVTSPWGLYDVAGGTREWMESVLDLGDESPRFRIVDGSAWATSGAGDSIRGRGGEFPSVSTFERGFRIASLVPAPGLVPLLALSLGVLIRRRRE